MLTASVTLEGNADAVLSALSPEIGRELPRTESIMTRDGNTLVITVNATDTSAMRAALNSYLGWIRITENINGM